MKKIIIATLIISSLFITSCSKQKEEKVQKYYKTITVSTWTINQNINYTWYTKWETQTMLATKAPWRIVYLNKEVWDSIYKWELIAKLDSAEAKTWYSTANSITNSLNSLKQATIESFNEQIKAMQAKIEQVQAWVNWLDTWLKDTQNITDSQIQTAKLWLETAKTNLEETKKTLEAKKNNILAWAKSAIIQNVILNENILHFIDDFLWVTPENEHKNDNFEDYIWVKDSQQLTNTKNTFRETKKSFDEYKAYYKKYIENKNPSETQLIEWLKKAKEVSSLQKTLLDETYTTLNNSVANIKFPLNTINQYKSQVSQFWSQLEQTILGMSWDTMLWIKWSLENLNTFDAQENKAISLLKKQVDIAWKQLQQYENMANWKINEVSTKKNIAQKQLEEAKAWLAALIAWKQAKLKELDSKITEALWKRNLSAVYINNWKVYSPVDWVIISKNVNIDQVIWAWMPIYTVASNKNIKIDLEIPNFVAKSLKLNQKVKVNIQATWKSYTGTIIQLPNVLNSITKKINIEILVKNENKEIPVWAMATVDFSIKNIINNNIKDSVIIPNDAIIQKYMLPWVYVIKNNKAIFTQITIISSTWNYSLVKWIAKNSKIITSWKENIYDWEEL